MTFKQLHEQAEPLLIGNVWDVTSAKIFESLNFLAVATSSAALAHTLGYEDGENLPFAELEFIVKRIISSITIPLSVDIEGGFSRDAHVIADYIERLFNLGVVGLNIEDSFMRGKRQLLPADEFQAILTVIKNDLAKKNIDIFINVRTDPFLIKLPNALEEAITRIHLYEQIDIGGIFVPCIEKESDISHVVGATKLPINVLCMPQLPDFETLKRLGVKRISMGNSIHWAMYQQFKKTVSSIVSEKSFSPVFDGN
ncbi:MAG: isocitrate lyase/phosphoenolpyruvate mutase family protein [bacterium]|nr:isocitrate lyase/phosphoenolpyruvate mutase family protein [bacterium]